MFRLIDFCWDIDANLPRSVECLSLNEIKMNGVVDVKTNTAASDALNLSKAPDSIGTSIPSLFLL